MARGYKNIRFEWNGSHSAVIGNLGFGKPLQRDAAEILYQNSFDYMPYYDGDLSTNVHIQATNTKANIVHQVKYANYQYELVTSKRYTQIHSLATSRWYEVAWKFRRRKITREVDEARMKYRKS